MSGIMSGAGMSFLFLADAAEKPTGEIFRLDATLIINGAILALAVFALFVLLSYLLFNPARDLLQKRQDRIKEQMDSAAKDEADAKQFKEEYSTKLKKADKEADAILSAARKKALKREEEIIDDAKEEASRIVERAGKEAELEKSKMKDEVKKQMVSVAAVMAGKIISSSIDETKQSQLIEDTLKEMGDGTWQN